MSKIEELIPKDTFGVALETTLTDNSKSVNKIPSAYYQVIQAVCTNRKKTNEFYLGVCYGIAAINTVLETEDTNEIDSILERIGGRL